MTVYLLLATINGGSKELSKTEHTISMMSAIVVSLTLLFQSAGGIVLTDLILIALLLVVSFVYVNKF